MTAVTLFCSGEGFVGFEARGHTGYDAEGRDIVCSAVSALTQTAAAGITDVLGIRAAVDIGGDSLYCMLPGDLSRESRKKAQIILDTMALGLRSVADTYGDYIKITERKV